MATCKIHGDAMMRNDEGAYCQACFERAGEDCVPCDAPQCACDFECERMVQHQRYLSTKNII